MSSAYTLPPVAVFTERRHFSATTEIRRHHLGGCWRKCIRLEGRETVGSVKHS